MDYKAIFDALSDIVKLRREGTRVAKKFDDEYVDYGTGYEIYQVGSDYIKIETYQDSYGNNFELIGIALVEPKTIIVEDFALIQI